MARREVTGTLWVLTTLVVLVCGGCLVLTGVGLIVGEITLWTTTP